VTTGRGSVTFALASERTYMTDVRANKDVPAGSQEREPYDPPRLEDVEAAGGTAEACAGTAPGS
jgi:hypothetical protein